MSKYYGKLCYLGEGVYGTIVRYEEVENVSGVERRVLVKKHGRQESEWLCSYPFPLLKSVRFIRDDNMLFVHVVDMNNQSYPGYAILSPSDSADWGFGRRLALARAMGDADAIGDLLDEDYMEDVDNVLEDGADAAEDAGDEDDDQ